MTPEDSAKALESQFADSIVERVEFRGEITLVVAPASLKTLLRYCRDELTFDFLVDISSLDHLGSEPRFEMVYELYSMESRAHLRIRSVVPMESNEVETVSDLWLTADWHEREVYDMMGIRFGGHPDLRRILMWEGYPYYPLRKDFPLGGRESELPDVAFTGEAPLAGGPFVTAPGDASTVEREPRSRSMK